MSSADVRAQVTYRFKAAPEAVFDAWLTSKLIRQWFAPGLGEMTRVIVDARVGGSFSFVQRRGMDDVEHNGAYVELRRPQRLVFTWSVKGTVHSSRVLIDIQPVGDQTELTLTHELQPFWADYRERTEASWLKMLTAMDAALSQQ